MPVYDGHEGFQLGRYWERPYEGEVSRGSMVMLLFSTRKGNVPDRMGGAPNIPKNVKFTVYFNTLGIVVLEEPSGYWNRSTGQGKAETYGMDKIVEYNKIQEEEMAEEEEGLEYNGKKLCCNHKLSPNH